MGEVVRVEFERPAERRHGTTIMRAMRAARKESGQAPEQWAETLDGQVSYDGVTVGAVECYEAGANTPGADYFLAAFASAGFPIHRLIELWLDENTRRIAVRILLVLLGPS